MKLGKWRCSSPDACWQDGNNRKHAAPARHAELRITDSAYQAMMGFGGCFNELGHVALMKLSEPKRRELLLDLFGETEEGCHLNFCRLPIGANDYSLDWYSLDEVKDDYELEHFSIDRDREHLVPYIKAALALNPELKLFASPWSPPAWMKDPPVYNWGKLIKTDRNLRSYASYFIRFIQEYRKEGIAIDQVHVQNEPVANQKFPSCMFTGSELRLFIRDYLGPQLRSSGLDTELWLGTINAPGCDYRRLIFDKWATEDYDYFANEVLSDPKARQYIAGVSYQWGGKIAIQRTYESWGDRIRLMQSENECGFGDNTWEYARYVWTMLKHYIANGAESYMYWNLILEGDGRSTWGDPQNAMVTIKLETDSYTLNPDYYAMKHFSSIIQRGARRLGLQQSAAGDALAFRNPDGTFAIELFNPFKEALQVDVYIGSETHAFNLAPLSFNSILLEEKA